MSQFYDQASLVVVPSGYKAGTVYAQKPLTTDGQLAFTRTGDTATRVNSAGLIERVRTNLILQSNTFNTTWANTSSTETGGQSGYDGTSNAWLLAASSAGGFISQNLSIAGLVTFSIYAKAGSQIGVTLYSSHAFQGRYFNLSTGALGGTFVAAPLDSKIESIGSGWYRCSITVSATATSDFRVYVSNGTANVTGNILIQAAQAEAGDIATPYIPTLTAAVSTGPTANVPRLDYLGSTCPRLLLEPQRTNLATYSEQFNNAAWAKSNATITANTVVSPDGYTNADTYTATSGSNNVIGYATSSGNNSITYSVFVKAGTQSTFQIAEAFYFGTSTIFNLSTGTVTSGTGTITSYGNGWYRCTHTQAYGAGQTNVTVVFNTTASSGTFHLWGAQFEVGAYATSYIPTLAATATRGDELLTKTSISSLIGQVEGTLLLEFDFVVGEQANYGIIYDAGFTSYIYVNQQTLGNIVGQIQPYGIAFSTAKTNGKYRCAIAYKSGDSAFFVNGVQIGSTNTTTFTLNTMDRFTFLNSDNTKAIHQALLFKTRLTNAQLAELTTL